MSLEELDAGALRAREHELTELLGRRRDEIRALGAQIAELNARLPGLRSGVQAKLKLDAAARPREPRTPGANVVLTLVLLPVAAFCGAIAGLFAWGFIGGPALILNPDPELVLTTLPVLIVTFVLLGVAYVLVKIWQ